MTTIEATRELRKHLGESQQAFATRLGLSMSAIANYEQGRAPTGRALVALAHAASQYGRRDLNLIFSEALVEEIKIPRDSLHYGGRTHDDGSRSGFVLMDVEGRERVEAIFAFAEVMGMSFHKDPKQRAIATKLLTDFTKRKAKAFKESIK